jgi:hypothetical protein
VLRAEKRDWITPSAGDTIHAECEVRRGAAQQEPPVKKQDGTVALIYAPLRMVKCRELTA